MTDLELLKQTHNGVGAALINADDYPSLREAVRGIWDELDQSENLKNERA